MNYMAMPGMGMGMGGFPNPQAMMYQQSMNSQDAPYAKRPRFDEPSRFNKSDSVFYKTRLCVKFAESGGCSFGDRCNYAHGEAELRPLNQEGQEILAKRAERDARDAAGAAGGSTAYRLNPNMCRSFVQTGECSYGDRCKFTHGAGDTRELRQSFPAQPAYSAQAPSQMPGQSHTNDPPGLIPGSMAMMDGAMGGDMYPGGMPLPGLNPRADMMSNQAMMGGLPFPGGMAGRQMGRPPPRPPQAPPPASALPTLSQGPGSLLESPLRLPPGQPSDLKALAKTAEEVPYEERIKALCMLMGVGAIKAADVSQPALAAARASIQTGLAFESSVYADAIDVYV